MDVRFWRCIAGCTLLLSGCISHSVTTQQAENKNNRTIISAKIKKMYPGAIILSFTPEVRNAKPYYSVEVKQHSERKRLLFSSASVLVELEETVRTEKLPDAVLKNVLKKFPQGEALYAQKLVRGKTTLFTIVVKNGTTREEVVLDSKGRPVQLIRNN